MINCGDKKGYAHTFINDWNRCLCGETSIEGLDKLMSDVANGKCALQKFSVNDEGDGVKETWSRQ